jgi:hypothetical protein
MAPFAEEPVSRDLTVVNWARFDDDMREDQGLYME